MPQYHYIPIYKFDVYKGKKKFLKIQNIILKILFLYQFTMIWILRI